MNTFWGENNCAGFLGCPKKGLKRSTHTFKYTKVPSVTTKIILTLLSYIVCWTFSAEPLGAVSRPVVNCAKLRWTSKLKLLQITNRKQSQIAKHKLRQTATRKTLQTLPRLGQRACSKDRLLLRLFMTWFDCIIRILERFATVLWFIPKCVRVCLCYLLLNLHWASAFLKRESHVVCLRTSTFKFS